MSAGDTARTATTAQLVARVAPVTELLVVLDFDGTLAPLVDHPDDSRLAPGARDAVAALCDRTRVAVLTGRPVDDVVPRLEGLPVEVVGGHGTQAVLADGEHRWLVDADALRRTLEELEEELRSLVDEPAGWYVEPKPTSIGVHHRRVPAEQREPTLTRVRDAMAARSDDDPGWVLTEGKAITELRPDGADKGTALAWLLDRHGGRPLVVGDDVTDEDAFAVAVANGGHAVLVAEEPRATAAGVRVATPEDVVDFVAALART